MMDKKTGMDPIMDEMYREIALSGGMEDFLEKQRRIERAAQAAQEARQADPAKPEGRRSIELAADLGDAHCQMMMARIYGEGKYVPVNHRRALAYLERAAHENHADAAWYYAARYYAGRIDRRIPVDLDRARDYLARAMNSDDAALKAKAGQLLQEIAAETPVKSGFFGRFRRRKGK